jgi:hypothetical protein
MLFHIRFSFDPIHFPYVFRSFPEVFSRFPQVRRQRAAAQILQTLQAKMAGGGAAAGGGSENPSTNQLGTMLNHSLQGVIMPNNKPLLGMIYYWAYRIIVLLRPRWVHGGDYLGYNPFE